MGSGAQVEHGFFTGTGAVLKVTSRIGFKPRKIELPNISADPAFGVWYEGMPDDSVIKQKAGTTTNATTNGITPEDDGFTIGTDADLNVDGEQVAYTAYR